MAFLCICARSTGIRYRDTLHQMCCHFCHTRRNLENVPQFGKRRIFTWQRRCLVKHSMDCGASQGSAAIKVRHARWKKKRRTWHRIFKCRPLWHVCCAVFDTYCKLQHFLINGFQSTLKPRLHEPFIAGSVRVQRVLKCLHMSRLARFQDESVLAQLARFG